MTVPESLPLAGPAADWIELYLAKLPISEALIMLLDLRSLWKEPLDKAVEPLIFWNIGTLDFSMQTLIFREQYVVSFYLILSAMLIFDIVFVSNCYI